MSRWIASHFDAYRQREKLPFLCLITIEGVAASLVVILMIGAMGLGGHPGREHLRSLSPVLLILVLCVLVPVIETFIFQTIPVTIGRAQRAPFWHQVWIATIPFALGHSFLGLGAGIGTGLFGGFYLAFTYVHWREESSSSAFVMTAASHALRNALATVLMLT